jgi:hypothetical protein
MSATVLTFPTRVPTPPPAGRDQAGRDPGDALRYPFAAAILRAGYKQAVHHARVTVPRLNAKGTALRV